jgi:CheY-like chemotaxis protein
MMAGLNLTILLIEDEPIIRMGTSAMLEDAGYLVLEAANTDEAQTLLTAHPEIAIVVTDVQMPGSMDGLALAQMLHRNHPEIRVLVTSGRSGSLEARECGNASFLPKPYTAAAIEKALAGLAS